MKAVIIYDNSATVVAILYGTEAVPDGVQGVLINLREGETIIGNTLDLSDPDNPKIETSWVETDSIRAAQAEMRKEIDDINITLADLIGGVNNA